jgi:hypothetical protein
LGKQPAQEEAAWIKRLQVLIFHDFLIFPPEKAACTSAKPDEGNRILSDWE